LDPYPPTITRRASPPPHVRRAPYVRWREVANVDDVTPPSAADGTRTLQISYVERANTDKNDTAMDETSELNLIKGIEGFWNVAFVTDGSNETIQGIMDFKPSS
ncbi:hypothetical protein, partial [Microbacterium sp. MRS-1]|uniref:hypothetical protein n=1 Tax=Microbacterium sp. MRS-1 TaxID=1451261 RepID=UPI001E58F71B